MTRESLHLGVEPVSETSVFTNCGKTETPETPMKSAKKRLIRVAFKTSRLMEFCNRRELVNQTGHREAEWPLVVLKELVDNALDASEDAEIAPVISIAVKAVSPRSSDAATTSTIVITDNGPGIPAETIDGVLDYSSRVSSREVYVSPTRGAQGNALMTILAMGYVLQEGEDAASETIIESHGVAHHILFSVDHIKQEPKIDHTTKASSVTAGTRITVTLPNYSDHQERCHGFNAVADCEDEFLELAWSYAWLNPHLTLRVTWNGECKLDMKASDPNWKKWLPGWPTSPHWYNANRFRRYMAAHVTRCGDITVREFVSEFCGLTGTAKQRQVLAEIGASHVKLHNFFGLKKVNTDNIKKLLASLKKHSKPVRPAELGLIGKEHLFHMMEKAGGEPLTFRYEKRLGRDDGLPRVVEVAFGVHKRGLHAGGRGPKRETITGVNWSPGINNPFRQLGRYGQGLDDLLGRVRANASEPIITVLHVACPYIPWTDRGKTAIIVDGKANDQED